MDPTHVELYAAQEREAVALFADFIDENAPLLRLVAHWGDGRCGMLAAMLRERLLGPAPRGLSSGAAKARIGASLRTAVLERDFYRCRHCGTHLQLTCDHVVPESKGGTTTIENLQTLCQPCNSRKGTECYT